MSELAKRIIRYRAIHNMSQGEMARKCFVTKQTIWAIENGRQNPTKLTEAKIEEVLKDAGI